MILACRDAARGQEVAAEVEAAQSQAGFKPAVRVEALDLSELASVERCAENVIASGLPLHLLINNGGVFDMSGSLLPTAEYSAAARAHHHRSLHNRLTASQCAYHVLGDLEQLPAVCCLR